MLIGSGGVLLLKSYFTPTKSTWRISYGMEMAVANGERQRRTAAAFVVISWVFCSGRDYIVCCIVLTNRVWEGLASCLLSIHISLWIKICKKVNDTNTRIPSIVNAAAGAL